MSDEKVVIHKQQNRLQLTVQVLEGGKRPKYGHARSAGLDIYSGDETFTLEPNQRALVSAGCRVVIQPNHVGWLTSAPRESLSGLIVANAPGIVDPSYQGELRVLLQNIGDEPLEVEHNSRIAQMVIIHAPRAMQNASNIGKREQGDGGYGTV